MATEISKEEAADIDAAIQARIAEMSIKDDDATASTTSRGSEQETAAEIIKTFNDTEKGGKSALREEIETFRMAEGKDHKDDVYVDNEYSGLKALRVMADSAAKKCGGVTSKKGQKWSFGSVPLEQFRRTIDDVYLSFLRWAKVEAVEGNSMGEKGTKSLSKENGNTKKFTIKSGGTGKINVSKAFRRLSVYAAWMEENRSDLEGWLTAESVYSAWEEWKMRLTYDKRGRIVWWMDMAAIDIEKCRNIPPEHSLRLFVWLSHVIMFDINAQQNGMVFACDFAKMGFWTLMNICSLKLGLKLDRLTIGVIPVKMKCMYMLGSPTWWDILMSLLGPFMSKKLRQRIINVNDNECNGFVQALGGAEFVPVGFHSCGGTLEKEIVSDTHFLSLKERYVLEES